MSAKDDHIIAVVEDALDGYEKFLEPEEMEVMRMFLATHMECHPVLGDFTDEQVPRPQAAPMESHEVPTNRDVGELKREYDAWVERENERKKKGA